MSRANWWILAINLSSAMLIVSLDDALLKIGLSVAVAINLTNCVDDIVDHITEKGGGPDQ